MKIGILFLMISGFMTQVHAHDVKNQAGQKAAAGARIVEFVIKDGAGPGAWNSPEDLGFKWSAQVKKDDRILVLDTRARMRPRGELEFLRVGGGP